MSQQHALLNNTPCPNNTLFSTTRLVPTTRSSFTPWLCGPAAAGFGGSLHKLLQSKEHLHPVTGLANGELHQLGEVREIIDGIVEVLDVIPPHTVSTHTPEPLPSILRRMTVSRSISRARLCDRRRSDILRSLPRHHASPCLSHRKVRHIFRTRSSLPTQLEERRTGRRLAARASTPCFP